MKGKSQSARHGTQELVMQPEENRKQIPQSIVRSYLLCNQLVKLHSLRQHLAPASLLPSEGKAQPQVSVSQNHPPDLIIQ